MAPSQRTKMARGEHQPETILPDSKKTKVNPITRSQRTKMEGGEHQPETILPDCKKTKEPETILPDCKKTKVNSFDPTLSSSSSSSSLSNTSSDVDDGLATALHLSEVQEGIRAKVESERARSITAATEAKSNKVSM
jgi:hypothetical protein